MLPLFGRHRDKDKEQLDELLSAYLDGELGEAQQADLDARLSRDPTLRAELRAMHRTVSLVRELPSVPAPRNFLVMQSMVEQRSSGAEVHRPRLEPERRTRAWVAPALTMATALVSLLFVVVLVSDLLLPGVGGLASAPAPLAELEAPLEAMTAEEGESGAYPAKDRAPSSPVPPQEGMEPLPEGEKAFTEEIDDSAAATRAAQAPPGAGATPPPAEILPEEEAAELGGDLEAPTVTAMTDLTPTIPAEAPALARNGSEWVAPTPDQTEVTAVPDPGAREIGALRSRPWGWIALEISLGLASVGLVVATIRAWRRRRRQARS